MKSYQTFASALLASTMLIAPAAYAQEAGAEDAGSSGGIDIGLSIQPTISDEIVVLGRNIPEPQRATSQVASFLNADDLKRTGDANAALALTRLSGLSVVGGKFAYVRGLGDRYSSARLNGSPLPSPEPLRRTVPLDLFPSNILAGAAVQKTYSPNYPGEFGGGVIDLQTLRRTEDSFLNVKLGAGMNTETTAHDGIFVNGGDRDWLGYDDGLRSMPAPLQALIDSGEKLGDQTPADIEAAGESLVNSPLSVLQNGTLGPDFEGTIDAGTSWELGQDTYLSLVGVFGYDQEWKTENALRQVVFNDGLIQDYDSKETSLNVTVNGLITAALEFDESIIQATGLYIHDTRKEAQLDRGFNFAAPGTQQIHDESSSFLERQLLMGQVYGEHLLSNFEIDWRGAFARSTRDSPYEQSLRRIQEPDGTPLYSQANNRNINFSYLTDDTLSGAIDLKYNVPFSGPREAEISIGYEYTDNDRTYDIYAFRFAGGNSLPDDVIGARPDYLFSPDNIDPARFVLIETSTSTDSYAGALTVHGAYGQIDAELIPTVRTTLGVRYEDGAMSVGTYDRFGNTGPGASIDNNYWLPSATVTWNFLDNMQFRVGYSQTIARPQFRELAPTLFFDPDSDRSYRGNRYLVDSEFKNYDARYEYYLGRNQFVTLGGFYKQIDNPIEESLFSQTSDSFNTTFINSPKADLYGGEFEYRTRFQLSQDSGFFAERDVIFSVNYTYTKSEIKVADGDVVINPFNGAELDANLFGLDGAALQGTPKHIVNTQLGWEGDNDQFTILLGWVGERILQRGISTSGPGSFPDVIERPGIQLDAVFRQDVKIHGTDFTIGLSARNLTGADHREYQTSGLGETEFDTYKRGRSLSASLTARF